eukprot:gene12741-50895_t
MAMYVTCFILTIIYELIVHHIDHVTTTHSAKNIIDQVDETTIALWCLFVGYGPLAILTVTFFKIRKEFRAFVSNHADDNGGKWRRKFLRDRQILTHSEFLEDETEHSIIAKHMKEVLKAEQEKALAELTKSKDEQHHEHQGHADGHGDGHGHGRMLLCDEGMLQGSNPS